MSSQLDEGAQRAWQMSEELLSHQAQPSEARARDERAASSACVVSREADYIMFDREETEELVEISQQSTRPQEELRRRIPVNSEVPVSKDDLFRQINKGKTVQCKLHRTKSNKDGMAEYNVVLECSGRHVLQVIKEGGWAYGCYFKAQGMQQVASIKSTFFGGNYTLIKEGDSNSLLTVSYESSFMGLNGPRKMKVYRPKSAIPEQYLHEAAEGSQWMQKIDQYCNKTPKWDEKRQTNVLNFRGRAKETSIKNFVLTDRNQSQDKFHVVFAKERGEVFNLDVEWPFSLMQGIAVAMTTFEFKLACD